MEISIKGLDKLAKKFADSPKVIEDANRQMMNVATMMVWGKAKELAPVDKHTLRNTMLRTYDHERGVVGSNQPYAGFQEFGTGIYGPKGSPIYPKTKPFLAWKGKDGQWRRARSVKGVQPRLFLTGALGYLKRNINQVKMIASKAIVSKLG
jgi:HK97 gp10 family phage protein